LKLSDFGTVPAHDGLPGIPARVTAVHRDRYEIVTDHGMGWARLKTKEYHKGNELFPTAGDFVMVHHIENGDSQIIATLPRHTVFTRRDPGPVPAEQAVAANFDYVFLLQSMNRDLNPRRLERYLTLAWQSGATPVVLLTKADLSDDHAAAVARLQSAAMGVDVHPVSSRTGYGLEKLEGYLKPGNTVVFLGSSGVGKSSLVNALAGEEIMATGAIREDDSRGRHTTTHRQLLRLRSGVLVIDTPGMRALGMWDVSEGLGESFADVEQFFGRCRFRDCRHQSEPGCAVRAAIDCGELSAERWESYQNLKREAKYADDPDSYLRRKTERNKQIAKFSRELKKRKP